MKNPDTLIYVAKACIVQYTFSYTLLKSLN